MRYELECLICGTKRNDLVIMQEHLMNVHQYTQRELMAQTHRHEKKNYRNENERSENSSTEKEEKEVIIYTMPDGKDWLKATRK